MRKTLLLVTVIVMCAPVASASDDWTHRIGIYGWLAGLDGTIGIGDKVESPVSATFEDLAGFVDFAMAGHYEARGPSSVFLADICYTGLGGQTDTQVLNQPATANMGLDQWIIELGGGYRVAPKFDILLAGRYYTLDTDLTVTVANEKSGAVSVDWFDIFLGARYHSTFGTKWFGSIRGDIGTGGSDFAWFGQIDLGYRFSDHFGAIAAFRVLSLDYEGDGGESYFRYDVVQSGLVLGLGYEF